MLFNKLQCIILRNTFLKHWNASAILSLCSSQNVTESKGRMPYVKDVLYSTNMPLFKYHYTWFYYLQAAFYKFIVLKFRIHIPVAQVFSGSLHNISHKWKWDDLKQGLSLYTTRGCVCLCVCVLGVMSHWRLHWGASSVRDLVPPLNTLSVCCSFNNCQ